MTRPVDVLAVMDSDAAEARVCRRNTASSYLAELSADSAAARLAVAELIDASRHMLNAPGDAIHQHLAVGKLRAALEGIAP